MNVTTCCGGRHKQNSSSELSTLFTLSRAPNHPPKISDTVLTRYFLQSNRYKPALCRIYLSCVLKLLFLSHAAAAPISIDIPLGDIKNTPRTGEVDHVFTTGFSKQIQRNAFENNLTTIADVISKESGIQTRQSGGFGGFSNLSIRGSTSEQVLIFIDGMLLNSAAGGGVDLGTLNLTSIDHIDIYRGATPLSLGNASIGGAININTLNAHATPVYQISASAASFNTQRYALNLSSGIDKLSYVIAAEHFESENDYRFLNGTKTRFNTLDDVETHRNNNQFKQNSILAKLGYNIHQHSRLDIMTQWSRKNKGIPSWNNHPDTRTTLKNQRWQTQLRLINNNLGPYQLNLSHELKYMLTKEEYDDRQAQVSLTQQHHYNQTTTLSARQYAELTVNEQLLGVNLELSKQRYTPKDLLNIRNYIASTRNKLSIGLDYKHFLLENNLIINPAINVTWGKDSRYSRQTGNETGIRNHYVEPRLGIKYYLNNNWILKHNLGRYIREPSFLELYGTQGLFKGNENILNEEGLNFDTGFEFNTWNTRFGINTISWQMVYFQSLIDNQITRTYNSRGIGTSTNIARVKINGIENALHITMFDWLGLKINSTWQNPVNLSKSQNTYKKQLPGRFRESHNLRIESKHRHLTPYVEYIYNRRMFYDTANNLNAPNKKLFNIGLNWFYDSFSGSIEITNVSDQRYDDFEFQPQPGRAYQASIRYKF